MFYLTTGGNGTGKTLLTIKDVHERSIKENRPVAYNGRFEIVEDGPLKNWKRIDAREWQKEPDGTIFFFDECHNDLPLRPAAQQPPEYIAQLAEHRRRGMDFYLLTQHPMNIDAFVRRLIADPGYHRHLKRMAGAEAVSVNRYTAVNPQCEKLGAGQSAETTVVRYPREVYSWYRSATLHTAKFRMPRQAWIFIGCVVLLPLVIWAAYRNIPGLGKASKSGGAAAQTGSPSASNGPGAQVASVGPMSMADYLKARTPRIDGFPHTAPAYDQVTQPRQAPYPAACVEGKKRGESVSSCECYSQQGTRLLIPATTCAQIVRNGFFVDWQESSASAAPAGDVGQARQSAPVARVDQAAPLQAPAAAPVPTSTVVPAAAAAAPARPSAAPMTFSGGPLYLGQVRPTNPDDELMAFARSRQFAQ